MRTIFEHAISGCLYSRSKGADIFISKLDSSGNFQWAKAMGSVGETVSGSSIAIDLAGSGGIYTTGEFGSKVDFDPGAGTFNLTATSDGFEGFITKLDNAGNFEWAKAMGGLCYDEGSSIAVDASGNVHVTGSFNGPSISFDSITLMNAKNDICSDADIFIAKLEGITTSLNNTESNTSQISNYPNPVTDELTIEFNEDNFLKIKIRMYNILGEVVYSTSVQNINHNTVIDVSSLSSGFYFVEMDIDGSNVLKKVVKE